MTKMRLYEYNNPHQARGTIVFNESYTGVTIRFGKDSELLIKLKENVKKFLEDNNLIIVSESGSNRSHNRYKNYPKKPKGFDTYIKRRDGAKKTFFEKIGEE